MDNKKSEQTPAPAGGAESLMGDLLGEIISTVIEVASQEKRLAEKVEPPMIKMTRGRTRR